MIDLCRWRAPTIVVALLLAAPAAATTPTPTGTPVFVPTPPGLFTLTGHVAAGPPEDVGRLFVVRLLRR